MPDRIAYDPLHTRGRDAAFGSDVATNRRSVAVRIFKPKRTMQPVESTSAANGIQEAFRHLAAVVCDRDAPYAEARFREEHARSPMGRGA